MSTEKQKHLCPVCGKYEFDDYDSYDICDVCGWEDEGLQEKYPDEEGCNNVSLNKAREAYTLGIMVDQAEDIKWEAETMTFSEALKAFKEGRPIT